MQRQIVLLHHKPFWGQLIHTSRTGMDREYPTACVAMEVVVMMVRITGPKLARRFVAGGLPREVDAYHLFAVRQVFQLAIDRGEIESRHVPLRKFADLRGRERTPATCQGRQYGVALSSVSFHARILPQMQTHLQYRRKFNSKNYLVSCKVCV